jgi:hypothetical protein
MTLTPARFGFTAIVPEKEKEAAVQGFAEIVRSGRPADGCDRQHSRHDVPILLSWPVDGLDFSDAPQYLPWVPIGPSTPQIRDDAAQREHEQQSSASMLSCWELP